jgi:DNA-binding transcriptional ArsR family regulator
MHYMNATATIERPDERNPTIEQIAAALADPTRRQVLQLVRQQEMSAGDLAGQFPDISRPAVSQHLRVLYDAGLVSVRPDGSRRMYLAVVEALTPMSQFIDDMWGDRLWRLKKLAEAKQ